MGELVLVLFGFTFILDMKWLPRFSRSIFLGPFVLWWAMGIGRAVAGVSEHGMWALRDATHVIESLFLWIGFIIVADPQAMERFFVWLRRILIISCLYVFAYPFRELLRDVSPTVEAAAGYTTSILFQYSGGYMLPLMLAVYLVIGLTYGPGIRSLVVAGLLVAYVVAIFQVRTAYLQLIALMLLLAWHRPTVFGKMGMAVAVAGLAFFAFVLSGVEIPGRLGQTMSLDFIARHFAAIWGVESEGVVEPARGVGQRLHWWAIIWRQITDNVGSFFFGLGYGIPLIEFHGARGQVVREPHNSFLSILGRMGLYGIIVFAWGHILLVRAWYRAYDLCRRAGYRLGQDRLLLFMVYFVLIWVYSLGEDAFEKPFVAIPYYFFWGIVLHYTQYLKRALTVAGQRAHAPAHQAPGQLHGSP